MNSVNNELWRVTSYRLTPSINFGRSNWEEVTETQSVKWIGASPWAGLGPQTGCMHWIQCVGLVWCQHDMSQTVWVWDQGMLDAACGLVQGMHIACSQRPTGCAVARVMQLWVIGLRNLYLWHPWFKKYANDKTVLQGWGNIFSWTNYMVWEILDELLSTKCSSLSLKKKPVKKKSL